jgi:hypothetical protein
MPITAGNKKIAFPGNPQRPVLKDIDSILGDKELLSNNLLSRSTMLMIRHLAFIFGDRPDDYSESTAFQYVAFLTCSKCEIKPRTFPLIRDCKTA